MKADRVIGWSTDTSGNSIGHYDSNPMLNTKVYGVMFPDGTILHFSANIIAESLYENSDEDVYHQYMEEVIGHKKLHLCISKADGLIKTKSGQNKKGLQRRVGRSWLVGRMDCSLRSL